VTFISSEAVAAWNRYKEERERVGEKVTPASPMLKDRWNCGLKWTRRG
jgi:hypothetical protein